MIAKSKLENDIAEYSDFRKMLQEHNDLDGLVISSPNHLHLEHAVYCLELGLPIILEKPLATNMEDCERIMDAAKANNGRCILGFVLRSTPFYSKINELLSLNTMGRVIAIQADELPGRIVSSVQEFIQPEFITRPMIFRLSEPLILL